MIYKEPVSVNEAKHLILGAVKSGQMMKLRVNESRGFVLAGNIKSPSHSPPFDNSAMDGYAIRFNDFVKGKPIRIIGESAAGNSYIEHLKPGQAIRIFTGAEIPPGGDTVVMQEKVSVQNDLLVIRDPSLLKGSNIRKAGSQIRKGATALTKGHYIQPASIGFISSLGLTEIAVFAKPVVTIIVTGDELVEPGKSLGRGQVYESNAQSLKAALEKEEIKELAIYKVGDDYKATLSAFRKALSKSDIIIFSGGISVGDYDYVTKVLGDEKVKTIFYKVKQKPGKPLYFGVKEKKLIFGLPGNPASILTCFYEYVIPALRKFQHYPQLNLPVFKARLMNRVSKRKGLTVFLKAHTDFNSVTVEGGQESYILKSFSEANCFVVLDETVSEVEKGSMVELHYFGIM